MDVMTIVRYGQPSKMDEAAYGSKCIVRSHHDDDYQLYLQVHKKSDDPKWELIGLFGPGSSQHYIDQLINMRLDKHKN